MDQTHSLTDIFIGREDAVTVLDVSMRAAIVYIAGLAIVRVGKRRLMGRATAIDMILAFILGSLFSRAMNGGAPVIATLVAGAILVLVHWGVTAIGRRSERWDVLTKGRCVSLVENGNLQERNMRSADFSRDDLYEALRLRAGVTELSDVRQAFMERNGDVSVLLQPSPRVVDVAVKEGVQTVRVELV